MRFKLRVIEGALKSPGGRNLQAEISVPVRRFFIGTAPDCHMRCAGNSISPHHCMILVEADRVIVRDDASQGGTFVNGDRIDTTACLFHGDRLRVGKLEFEVLMPEGSRSNPLTRLPAENDSAAIESANTESGNTDSVDNCSAENDPPEKSVDRSDPEPARSQRETIETTETIADIIVDMLCMEDEAERDRRRLDPAALEYRPHNDFTTPESSVAESSDIQKLPVKRPPTTLPPPSPVRGLDSVDAAEQALSRLLESELKKKPS